MVTMKMHYHYDVRPNDTFVTELEFDIDTGPTGIEAEEAAMAWAAEMTDVFLNTVFIDRVVISTWVKDGDPYDPSTLRVVPIGIFGSVGFTFTTAVDDDIVLFVRKNVNSGRSGKIQLRGCLVMSDLSVSAGSWVLDTLTRTGLTTAFDDLYDELSSQSHIPVLIGAATLGWQYPATAEGVKQIPVKLVSNTPTVRNITGFTVVGAKERQDTQ